MSDIAYCSLLGVCLAITVHTVGKIYTGYINQIDPQKNLKVPFFGKDYNVDANQKLVLYMLGINASFAFAICYSVAPVLEVEFTHLYVLILLFLCREAYCRGQRRQRLKSSLSLENMIIYYPFTFYILIIGAQLNMAGFCLLVYATRMLFDAAHNVGLFEEGTNPNQQQRSWSQSTLSLVRYVCMYVFLFICMYVCMYVCVCMCA